MIPDSHTDLLTEAVTVTLVTLMPDGQPQATPVWVDYDGTHLLVNVGEGRQKDRNIRRNPKVTVLAIDPKNPYRYLEVRGVVEEIVVDETGDNMNALSLKYRGTPKRYGLEAPPREVETRVYYRIKPLRVIAR
ncbi:MAG: PPOX class F420-dependent oxidoreductase [Anaerolineae bacterium]|nr:PPOX class F420-dependent oxidoreductase [Anaerolineae bacterium]